MTTNKLNLRNLALASALVASAVAAPALAANDEGFFFEPEAIYMEFRGTDVDYAFTGATIATTEAEEVEHDYELGWRAGLGYKWASGWDLTFRGTHLDNEESAFTDDSKGVLLSVQSVTNFEADEAFAEIDTTLEYLDVEVGKVFGDDMDDPWARIFFGPRFSSFENDLFVFYDGDDADDNEIFRESDVDAYGIRAGLEGHAPLGDDSGWSFFGWGAVSALVGDFDTFGEETDDTGTTLVEEFEDDEDNTIAVLEAGLGFQWMSDGDDFNWGVRFGYEIQNWTDMVTDFDISDSADDDNGDLGVDGGFLRFSLIW